MTDPFFIRLTIWRVTSFGADAPGISTPPITKSASAVARAMEYEFDACVRTTPPKMSSSSRSRFRLTSMIVTSAPMPAAIFAAFVPTTPPPMITTLAGGTPGTPPSSTPRPPFSFSR